MNNTPFIITGSSGYVGSALSYYLKSTYKNVFLIGVDMKRPPAVSRLDQFYEVDLRDTSKIADLISRVNAGLSSPPIFIHTAALFVKKFRDRNNYSDKDYYIHNIDVLKSLVDIVSHTPVCKFVFMSSAIASATNRADLSAQKASLDAYAQTKLEGEDLLKSSHLPWVIIRPVRILGYINSLQQKSRQLLTKHKINRQDITRYARFNLLPDDIVSYFLIDYFNNLSHNEPYITVKPGNLKRTYIHVQDVVSGLACVALNSSITKKVFRFSTYSSISLEEIARVIASGLKSFGFPAVLKIENSPDAGEVFIRPSTISGWNLQCTTSHDVIEQTTRQYLRFVLQV